MINFTNKAGFNLKGRHRAEQQFQWGGRFAIFVSLAFLALMFATLLRDGTGVIKQTQIAVAIDLGADAVDPQDVGSASFGKILKSGLRDKFPDVSKRKDKKKLYNLVSSEGAFEITLVFKQLCPCAAPNSPP